MPPYALLCFSLVLTAFADKTSLNELAEFDFPSNVSIRCQKKGEDLRIAVLQTTDDVELSFTAKSGNRYRLARSEILLGDSGGRSTNITDGSDVFIEDSKLLTTPGTVFKVEDSKFALDRSKVDFGTAKTCAVKVEGQSDLHLRGVSAKMDNKAEIKVKSNSHFMLHTFKEGENPVENETSVLRMGVSSKIDIQHSRIESTGLVNVHLSEDTTVRLTTYSEIHFTNDQRKPKALYLFPKAIFSIFKSVLTLKNVDLFVMNKVEFTKSRVEIRAKRAGVCVEYQRQNHINVNLTVDVGSKPHNVLGVICAEHFDANAFNKLATNMDFTALNQAQIDEIESFYNTRGNFSMSMQEQIDEAFQNKLDQLPKCRCGDPCSSASLPACSIAIAVFAAMLHHL